MIRLNEEIINSLIYESINEMVKQIINEATISKGEMDSPANVKTSFDFNNLDRHISTHFSIDRRERIEKMQYFFGGNLGTPVFSMEINNNHPDGEELHTVTNKSVVIVQNAKTLKYVTAYPLDIRSLSKYYDEVEKITISKAYNDLIKNLKNELVAKKITAVMEENGRSTSFKMTDREMEKCSVLQDPKNIGKFTVKKRFFDTLRQIPSDMITQACINTLSGLERVCCDPEKIQEQLTDAQSLEFFCAANNLKYDTQMSRTNPLFELFNMGYITRNDYKNYTKSIIDIRNGSYIENMSMQSEPEQDAQQNVQQPQQNTQQQNGQENQQQEVDQASDQTTTKPEVELTKTDTEKNMGLKVMGQVSPEALQRMLADRNKGRKKRQDNK